MVCVKSMDTISEQLRTAEGREWLAMLFVLGELSEDQCSQFEAAMLEDVALCEVVVEASRISAGLVLALETKPELSRPVAIRQRSAISRFTVFAAGTALVVLLIAVVNSQFFFPAGHSVVVEDADAADALVNLLSTDPPADVDAESDDEPMLDDSIADLVAPEWLLTAVDLDEAEVDGDKDADDDSAVF